jgi:hypothetical protein
MHTMLILIASIVLTLLARTTFINHLFGSGGP